LCLAALLPLLGSAPPGAAAAPGTPLHINYALTVPQLAANCKRELARAGKAAAAIASVRSKARTFRTVVLPLEDLSSDANDRLVAETLLSQVSTDRATRDASLKCQDDVNNFFTVLTARPDLYRAVADAAASGTATTVADKKLTALWLIALKRSGAGLAPGPRADFVKLNQRLNTLQTQFAANLGNDTTTIELAAPQLAGLSDDFVATFKKHGDLYVVPVNESSAGRFMQNASAAAARKTFYLADANVAYPKNVVLLEEALALRDRIAHLIGYKNWAEYVLADRMAQRPERVRSFLSNLDQELLGRAKSDLAGLAKLKAADLKLPAGSVKIDPWDTGYYDNMLLKTTYAVDDNEVRNYFPVEHVERAVFDIYAQILGVRYTQRTPVNGWVDGLTEWAVTDAKSGRYLGDFYLDLFPRQGKYSHFASFTLLPARRLPDGTLRPPQDAIIGNWPEPAPGKSALLSHSDVETFFHEFGHDMAAILATAPYETLSSGFRQDFIEAPSQMLENWVWDPTILKKLSAHYQTGAPLPDALIAKIRAARYVDHAYFTTRQIMLATIDMDYHTAGPKVDTTAVWRAVSAKDTPLATPPGVYPQSSFGHIMGGYDAGYYGYLWSLVYAQDMFTAFERGGLESPLVGARYRKDILEPARTYEPDQEVTAFLGRPMSPAAFYKEFGIAR
jgi:thimet oligopeptidase